MLKHSAVAGTPRRWTWSLVALGILALAPFQLAAKTPLRQAPSQSPLNEPAQSVPAEPAPRTAPAPRERTELPQRPVSDGRGRIETAREDNSPVNDAQQRSGPFFSPDGRLLAFSPDGRLVAFFADGQLEVAERQAQPEAVATQQFLRAQIAELSAQLERMARVTRQDSEKSIEEAYRQSVLAAEKAFAAQEMAEAQDRSASVAMQLEALREQQQALIRQIEQIAEQQKALVEMQRQMAEETGRLREALKSR